MAGIGQRIFIGHFDNQVLAPTDEREKRATHQTGGTLLRFTKQEAAYLGRSADGPYKPAHFRY